MSPTGPLPPAVFTILSGLIEERTGLFFGPADAEILADKLRPRMIERGFESLLDYYYFLRYDPEAAAELLALAEHLVVNETYFFRELPQLRVLAEELLPPLISSGQRPRVWCAASSTGEEPISIAALLQERGLLGQVELLATDISQRALQRARAGRYGQRSRRALSGPVPWLQEVGNEAVVSPALLEQISFRQLNLMEDAGVQALGSFDVIVCRNVLIYFRDETARLVVARLERALKPGGYLLVGVSESLLRFGTSLTCQERGGAFLYRKADI